MTETIIVAVISLIGTLGGSFLASRRTQALVVYRLEQLEKKVGEHNHLDSRMTALEAKVDALTKNK